MLKWKLSSLEHNQTINQYNTTRTIKWFLNDVVDDYKITMKSLVHNELNFIYCKKLVKLQKIMKMIMEATITNPQHKCCALK